MGTCNHGECGGCGSNPSVHNIKSNLLNSEDFKNRVYTICNEIANIVSSSMGPFGRSTVIQTIDNVYTTKDGWNIMNQLNFKNPTDNSIAKMIINVAQSVVLKVGDGTTSSVVVANELNKLIVKYMADHPNITPREIEDCLKIAVDMIVDNLKMSATEITDENKSEIINKIALVATNWDTELSDLISTVYERTDNPIIKIQDSGTEHSYVEVEDGYDLSAKLVAPDIFATNGEYTIDEPMIIVYDHGVRESDFLTLYSIAGTINNNEMLNKPKLVVLAPSFEEGFVTRMRATFASCVKSGKLIDMPIVPVKYVNSLIIDRECAGDFTALIGGVMITKSSTDFNNKFKELGDFIINMAKKDSSVGENPQETLSNMLAEMVNFIIENHAGGCDSVKIDDKHIVAIGLTSANVEVVDKTKQFLINEIDKLNKEADARTTLSENIRLKKTRLGKLNCNMGTIMVGGYGDAYLKARRDALDDAVRACEAAYRNGYVCGNGIATVKAAADVNEKLFDDFANTNYKSSKINCVLDMGLLIERAFCKIFFTLVANSKGMTIEDFFRGLGTCDDMYGVFMDFMFKGTLNENAIEDIKEAAKKNAAYTVDDCEDSQCISAFYDLVKCINQSCAYDLINDNIDIEHNIINPVDVDIEVIKGCLRLVLISITSNQMLTKYDD